MPCQMKPGEPVWGSSGGHRILSGCNDLKRYLNSWVGVLALWFGKLAPQIQPSIIKNVPEWAVRAVNLANTCVVQSQKAQRLAAGRLRGPFLLSLLTCAGHLAVSRPKDEGLEHVVSTYWGLPGDTLGEAQLARGEGQSMHFMV